MLFKEKGQQNTEATIDLAIKKCRELGINNIITASSTGHTAKLLRNKAPKEMKVVCVTYHFGFKENGKNMMEEAVKQELEEQNVPVLATTHLMAGLDRALRFKFEGVYPAEIIANTLRMLGQGVKVAVEVASMALDAGLIPYGQEVVSIGGHGNGADTAIIIIPGHSNYFFETKVKEIICRPREF
jgi:hypothetical protein